MTFLGIVLRVCPSFVEALGRIGWSHSTSSPMAPRKSTRRPRPSEVDGPKPRRWISMRCCNSKSELSGPARSVRGHYPHLVDWHQSTCRLRRLAEITASIFARYRKYGLQPIKNDDSLIPASLLTCVSSSIAITCAPSACLNVDLHLKAFPIARVE